MNNKFDELAKGLAQSVTRRQALRCFGVGIAAGLLAPLGFPSKADANPGKHWRCNCRKAYWGCDPANFDCIGVCGITCSG